MVKRHAISIFICLGLAGCGDLGNVQFAPGQFRIHGSGKYDNESDVVREAARVCPHGYTKINEFEAGGTAEGGGDLLLDVICNGNSK
ncbi:MAG TPA: hypothetical protein VHX92_04765 [Rhizomicrobium sp.]|jgi:hypothetical protein|nr:hypothetical protein [Rhizomicrobium sp.]